MKYHLAVVVHLHKALFQPQILTLSLGVMYEILTCYCEKAVMNWVKVTANWSKTRLDKPLESLEDGSALWFKYVPFSCHYHISIQNLAIFASLVE